jgi:hypothetical protein
MYVKALEPLVVVWILVEVIAPGVPDGEGTALVVEVVALPVEVDAALFELFFAAKDPPTPPPTAPATKSSIIISTRTSTVLVIPQ